MIHLYVKQHDITKLKYFGKTIRSNPFSYTGSGTRWIKHIKENGKQHVKTLEVYSFDSQKDCTEFAIDYSKKHSIDESKEWANLQLENGKNGPVGQTKEKSHMFGKKLSSKTKEKMSNSRKGNLNPSYDKIWVNNGIKQLYIGKEEDIPIGFTKGVIKNNSDYIKKTMWVNNGLINKRILAFKQIPEGFTQGRLKYSYPKNRKSRKNNVQ